MIIVVKLNYAITTCNKWADRVLAIRVDHPDHSMLKSNPEYIIFKHFPAAKTSHFFIS